MLFFQAHAARELDTKRSSFCSVSSDITVPTGSMLTRGIALFRRHPGATDVGAARVPALGLQPDVVRGRDAAPREHPARRGQWGLWRGAAAAGRRQRIAAGEGPTHAHAAHRRRRAGPRGSGLPAPAAWGAIDRRGCRRVLSPVPRGGLRAG